MAVPKKRVSRTRKLLRQGQWKLKIFAQARHALSLGRGNQNAGKNITPSENANPGSQNGSADS
jgi:hypothetical protein